MKEQEKKIRLNAFAKVNLCLDVKGLMENGFHEVHMILQQIGLCDEVLVRWRPGAGPSGEAGGGPSGEAGGGLRISIGTNRPYLPTDRRNLAFRAAEVMAQRYAPDMQGSVRIDILKRIPVAAGLAGGSSNCAAVIHALNCLWDLGLGLKELCEAGSVLGSDVPFCVMGQAAADPVLKERFKEDPLACHCAVASGRGTNLQPIRGLESDMVLSKPPVSVSTAEVYRGIDEAEIPQRPDVDAMAADLEAGRTGGIEKNMVNVLENVTLKKYPIIVYTKDKMQSMCKPEQVLMSGSGPTVFGLCGSRGEAKKICESMREMNRESFWTRTTY